MKPTALVTGASSGIGRDLAREFAQHGYDLVLVARNRGALDDVARALAETKGEGEHARPAIQTVALDLSVPHSAQALAAQLQAAGTQVDVLVNNAGFGLQGEFAALPLDRQIEMIQLNVVTLTELTRLLLPAILARNSGGVLNVASTAAFQPGPLMAVYYATKAYVLSFTEAIAEESANRGVKITCLCPGPTGTAFASRAGVTGTNLFKRPVMDAADVAREGFAGWNSGKVVVVPGAGNRRGAMVVRFAPRAFVRRVIKRLNSHAS